MREILINHLAQSSAAERGIALRRIIQRCREVADSRPGTNPAELLVGNVMLFLDDKPVRVDASGWREKAEAAHELLSSALEMQPTVEDGEVEAVRSLLRATAEKLHAVATARRSKIIRKYWDKRLSNVSEDEARESIRVILALIDFPSPEFETWDAGRAILIEKHGQAIIDAAEVTYSDPDIRGQVARETTEGFPQAAPSEN